MKIVVKFLKFFVVERLWNAGIEVFGDGVAKFFLPERRRSSIMHTASGPPTSGKEAHRTSF